MGYLEIIPSNVDEDVVSTRDEARVLQHRQDIFS